MSEHPEHNKNEEEARRFFKHLDNLEDKDFQAMDDFDREALEGLALMEKPEEKYQESIHEIDAILQEEEKKGVIIPLQASPSKKGYYLAVAASIALIIGLFYWFKPDSSTVPASLSENQLPLNTKETTPIPAEEKKKEELKSNDTSLAADSKAERKTETDKRNKDVAPQGKVASGVQKSPRVEKPALAMIEKAEIQANWSANTENTKSVVVNNTYNYNTSNPNHGKNDEEERDDKLNKEPGYSKEEIMDAEGAPAEENNAIVVNTAPGESKVMADTKTNSLMERKMEERPSNATVPSRMVQTETVQPSKKKDMVEDESEKKANKETPMISATTAGNKAPSFPYQGGEAALRTALSGQWEKEKPSDAVGGMYTLEVMLSPDGKVKKISLLQQPGTCPTCEAKIQEVVKKLKGWEIPADGKEETIKLTIKLN